MNALQTAQNGYGTATAHVRTPRGIEYETAVRITARLKAAAVAGQPFTRLAEAIVENNRLWTTFMSDVALENNGLPETLRVQILSLGKFSYDHGLKVLRGEAKADPLIEINTAILRGLAGAGGAA